MAYSERRAATATATHNGNDDTTAKAFSPLIVCIRKFYKIKQKQRVVLCCPYLHHSSPFFFPRISHSIPLCISFSLPPWCYALRLTTNVLILPSPPLPHPSPSNIVTLIFLFIFFLFHENVLNCWYCRRILSHKRERCDYCVRKLIFSTK